MKRKIVGVTVGTPISPKLIKEKLNPIRSINGKQPDADGYVKLHASDVCALDKNQGVKNAGMLMHVDAEGNLNPLRLDAGLEIRDGVLSVNTANEPEQDNSLPITSAGVYATVGNINALLHTI